MNKRNLEDYLEGYDDNDTLIGGAQTRRAYGQWVNQGQPAFGLFII